MSGRGRGKRSNRGGKESNSSGYYVTSDTAVHITSSSNTSSNSKSYEQSHKAETWDVEAPKKDFGAGGIPVGPSKRIHMIVQVANGLLEKRWKQAQDEKLLENMKKLAIQHMSQKTQQSGKISRAKRIAMYTQNGIDMDLLERVEFVHYFAIPVQVSPQEFIEKITDDVWTKVLAMETNLLQGTPFEKYLQTSIADLKANFEVEEMLQKFYDQIIKVSNFPRDYCYMVGIEPKSVGSIFCNYKKTNLTAFKGHSKPYHKSYWDCAKEEIATESCVDYGPFATTQCQCRLQKREVPASLSVGNARLYLLLVGNDTGAYVDQDTWTLCMVDSLDEILNVMTKSNEGARAKGRDNDNNDNNNNGNDTDALNTDLKKLQLSS